MTHPALAAEPLWTRARAMYARALAAVGAPATVAAIADFNESMRRKMVRWIAPLECIVRKLLLAEAEKLRRAGDLGASIQGAAGFASAASQNWSAGLPARISSDVPKQSAARAARSNLDASRPATWSARFSLSMPRDPLAVPEARAPRIRNLFGPEPTPVCATAAAPRAAVRTSTAFRLARRLEALRRVLADPLPYAERLARLLVRLRRSFPEVTMRFAMAPARAATADFDDPRLVLEATGQALATAWGGDDTS